MYYNFNVKTHLWLVPVLLCSTLLSLSANAVLIARGGKEGTQSGGGGGNRLEPARKTGVLVIEFLRNHEKGRRLVEEYNIDVDHLEAANHNDNYAPIPNQIEVDGKFFDMYVDPEKVNTFYVNDIPFDVFGIQIFSPPTLGLVEYSPQIISKELIRSIDRNELVIEENVHIKIEILMEDYSGSSFSFESIHVKSPSSNPWKQWSLAYRSTTETVPLNYFTGWGAGDGNDECWLAMKSPHVTGRTTFPIRFTLDELVIFPKSPFYPEGLKEKIIRSSFSSSSMNGVSIDPDDYEIIETKTELIAKGLQDFSLNLGNETEITYKFRKNANYVVFQVDVSKISPEIKPYYGACWPKK